ncbi:hypothetical protein BGZ67_009964 [Mortierella alpina]|nr:hypothetical protein BGZ67_009964 [Mortierella alpina]
MDLVEPIEGLSSTTKKRNKERIRKAIEKREELKEKAKNKKHSKSLQQLHARKLCDELACLLQSQPAKEQRIFAILGQMARQEGWDGVPDGGQASNLDPVQAYDNAATTLAGAAAVTVMFEALDDELESDEEENVGPGSIVPRTIRSPLTGCTRVVMEKEPPRSRLCGLQTVLRMLQGSPNLNKPIDANWVKKAAFKDSDFTLHEREVIPFLANMLWPYVLKRRSIPGWKKKDREATSTHGPRGTNGAVGSLEVLCGQGPGHFDCKDTNGLPLTNYTAATKDPGNKEAVLARSWTYQRSTATKPVYEVADEEDSDGSENSEDQSSKSDLGKNSHDSNEDSHDSEEDADVGNKETDEKPDEDMNEDTEKDMEDRTEENMVEGTEENMKEGMEEGADEGADEGTNKDMEEETDQSADEGTNEEQETSRASDRAASPERPSKPTIPTLELSAAEDRPDCIDLSQLAGENVVLGFGGTDYALAIMSRTIAQSAGAADRMLR